MKTVKIGSTVLVDYEGRLTSGKLFDTSIKEVAKEGGLFSEDKDYKPLNIKVGENQLIKGFEEALVGMKEEEEKEVTIPPEKAYGNKRDEYIQFFERKHFRGLTPRQGMVAVMEFGGYARPARIVEVEEEKVKLDFNHVLCDKTLVFKIKVVKIEEEQIAESKE